MRTPQSIRRLLQGWRAVALIAAVLTVSSGSVYSNSVSAPSRSPDDLYIRVVDVGNGLCTVTLVPGGYVMVYDAGHWQNFHCTDAIQELVPADRDIDLLVLSHSDGDHIGNVAEILAAYRVKLVLRTGYVRSTNTWRRANEAIAREVSEGASVINLGTMSVDPGERLTLGPAEVTFIAGWHEWKGSGPTFSERRNAISIVMRLEFQGKSVLFTGDTIGRRLNDDNSACKDAEKAIVENANIVPLKSDIMTAPHHGGNNGSSNCFIRAVNPRYVIFSAGRGHHHPAQAVADRYIANGVPVENLLRTDRGDNEGGSEWIYGAIAGCRNPPGGDDVEIIINAAGQLTVAYRLPASRC